MNSGIATDAEQAALFERIFSDPINICQLSPFNTYWTLQALGRMGKAEEVCKGTLSFCCLPLSSVRGATRQVPVIEEPKNFARAPAVTLRPSEVLGWNDRARSHNILGDVWCVPFLTRPPTALSCLQIVVVSRLAHAPEHISGDLPPSMTDPAAVNPSFVPWTWSGITSLCHPWAAGPAFWMSQNLLGVKPTAPGFRRFEIKPLLADSLQAVSGVVPSILGECTATLSSLSAFPGPTICCTGQGSSRWRSTCGCRRQI